MRRLLGFIGGLFYFPLAAPAFANGTTPVNICPSGQFIALCNFTSGDFGRIIGTLINLVFVIALIIAVFFLIYGGVKWIISGGDKSAVEAARNHIVAAIVGLVIVFLTYFIINIVIGFFLPGLSLSNLQLPHL